MFKYEIKVSSRARRSTSIKIVDGKVVVTTPRWTPKKWVEELVESKKEWIEKHLMLQPAKQGKKYEEGEKFLYLGRDYPLEITRSERKRPTLKLLKDSFWLSAPKGSEGAAFRSQTKKAFEAFYRKRAKVYLWQRTRYYANILGAKFADIRIKDTKTRWGSCSSLGNINYSWRLILTPPEVLDSVVAHEVCHLIHQHHKKTFWELLYRLYPSYKKDHHWLVVNKYLLHI
jgi:predicted metal-dependent hydrolase